MKNKKYFEECVTVEDMTYLNRAGVEIEVNDGKVMTIIYPDGERFERR